MKKILTIGTATLDTFIKADFLKTVSDKNHLTKIGFKSGTAQCFSLGSKVEIDSPEIFLGGGACNSAVTFSRSGFKTQSLIRIGNDYAGHIILDEIKEEKVNPIAIIDQKEKSGTSFILLNGSGERTILVNRGASNGFKKRDVPLFQFGLDWAYICPGAMDFSVLSSIIDSLYENKILIAINPSMDLIDLGIEKIKPILNKSKVVILNKEEASYLTGVSYFDKKKIFKKTDGYVKGIVVITDGKKGAYASDGKNILESGSFEEIRVVDRTGAGDAFGSGFVAGLIESKEKFYNGICKKENLAYALRRAAANATSVIENVGAQMGILTRERFDKDKRWKRIKINIAKA